VDLITVSCECLYCSKDEQMESDLNITRSVDVIVSSAVSYLEYISSL